MGDGNNRLAELACADFQAGQDENHELPEGVFSARNLVEAALNREDPYDLPPEVLDRFPENKYDPTEYIAEGFTQQFAAEYAIRRNTPAAFLTYDIGEDGNVTPVLRMRLTARDNEGNGRKTDRVMVEISFRDSEQFRRRLEGEIIGVRAYSVTAHSLRSAHLLAYVNRSAYPAVIFPRVSKSNRLTQEKLPLGEEGEQYTEIIREKETIRERLRLIEEVNRLIPPLTLQELENLYWRSLQEIWTIQYFTVDRDQGEFVDMIPTRFEVQDFLYDLGVEWGIPEGEQLNAGESPLITRPENRSAMLMTDFTEDNLTKVLPPVDINQDPNPVGSHHFSFMGHDRREPSHSRGAMQILRAAQIGHALHNAYRYKQNTEHVPADFTDLVYRQIHTRWLLSMVHHDDFEESPNAYVTLLRRRSEDNIQALNDAIKRGSIEYPTTSERIDSLDLEPTLEFIERASFAVHRNFGLEHLLLSHDDTLDAVTRFSEMQRDEILVHLVNEIGDLGDIIDRIRNNDDNGFSRAADLLGTLLIGCNTYLGDEHDLLVEARAASLMVVLSRFSRDLTNLIEILNQEVKKQKKYPDFDWGE